MRDIAKWIGTFGLLCGICVSAAEQEPKTGAPQRPNAAPTSGPSDDIDPAQVSTIKADVPDSFVTHKDPSETFTIKTPPSWQEAPHGKPVAILLKSDKLDQSVNVVVVPSPPAVGLKVAMESLPKTLEKQFKGFKLIKSDYVLYCGQPSGRLLYEVQGTNGRLIRILQIFLIRGGKDYVVTFTAPASTYDDAYKTAEPVMASFELPGDKPTSQPG